MKQLFSIFLVILSFFTFELKAQKSTGTKNYLQQQKDRNEKLIGKKYSSYSFKDMSSKVISDSTNKGKVVLFSFWFIGCTGCIKEIEYLNQINKKLSNNKNFCFEAITFNTEEELDSKLKILKIIYPVASIPKDELELMKFGGGYPRYLILNKENIIHRLGLAISDKSTETCESYIEIIKEIKKLIKE